MSLPRFAVSFCGWWSWALGIRAVVLEYVHVEARGDVDDYDWIRRRDTLSIAVDIGPLAISVDWTFR